MPGKSDEEYDKDIPVERVGGLYGAGLRSITLSEHWDEIHSESNGEEVLPHSSLPDANRDTIPLDSQRELRIVLFFLGVIITWTGFAYWLGPATDTYAQSISTGPIWIVASGLILLLFSAISAFRNERKVRLVAGTSLHSEPGVVVPGHGDGVVGPPHAEPELAYRVATRERCENCGTVFIITGRRYCPMCGTRLPFLPGTSAFEEKPSAPPILPMIPEQTTRGPKCMVCELTMKRKDVKLFCPYCGNAAHRDHLLEWLHVKKVCPMCGQRIQESELRKTIRRSKMYQSP